MRAEAIPPVHLEPEMFRHSPERHAMLELGREEVHADLRDEPDPDPVVEAATQRLREQLSTMEPVDQWGRPVAWRQVARIALGDLVTTGVRDALTTDVLVQEVAQRTSVVPDREPEKWRTFFQALDDTDRLLG